MSEKGPPQKRRSEVSENCLIDLSIPQGCITIREWAWGKGWGRKITNIFKNCYLHIKFFPTNSLAALMWRWYLNSWEFWGVLNGIGRNSQNPTYTCMIKIIPRSWYITWKGGLKKRIGKTPEKALRANYWTLITLLINKL